MSKVGVGIITCDRIDMYDVCQKSIKDDWYDEFVVVDDGTKEHLLVSQEQIPDKTAVTQAKYGVIETVFVLFLCN